MVSVQKCSCKNEFQDKLYGNGMRVHNYKAKQQNKVQEVCCSVCSSVKQVKNEVIS